MTSAPTGRVAAAVAAGVAAIGVSAVVAQRGMPRWEERLFNVIHRTPRPATVALFLPMQLGAAAAPAFVGVAAARAGQPRHRVAGVVATGLTAWWAGKVVKRVVGRGRPLALVAGTVVAPGGSRTGLGFVSGHAAVSAATAVVLAPALPRRWRWAGPSLAAVVAVARVQNGSHLPLDVVGGAGLGVVLGGLWRLGTAHLS